MTSPPAAPTTQDTLRRSGEEIDVWWGSYAGRDMAPSFAICIGLTALIYFGTSWRVPERGWLQFTFTGLASAVWLVQLVRWGRRFFGWNYRVTSRYLYVDRGLMPLVAQRFSLRDVGRVDVRCNMLQTWLGLGDLWIGFDDKAIAPAVLQALVGPRAAAELIRNEVKKARENVL